MGWYYMANIKEKIYAEMENITKVLIELDSDLYSEFKEEIDNSLMRIE